MISIFEDLKGRKMARNIIAVTNICKGHQICTVYTAPVEDIGTKTYHLTKQRVWCNKILYNYSISHPIRWFWEWRDGQKRLLQGLVLPTGLTLDLSTGQCKNIPNQYLAWSRKKAIAQQKINNKTYQED